MTLPTRSIEAPPRRPSSLLRGGGCDDDGNWPVRDQVCCRCLRVRKLGNIYVLAEWTRSDGQKKRLVLGPYWHFLVVTLCVISSVSAMIYAVVIPTDYVAERVVGITLTILAVTSLLCTAMTDPGIFPRYSKPLAQTWTYSEYAQAYRPPGVIYCQQCQVLIEEYNHFCPWSGIVIGKGNEAYFQVFVCALVLAFLFDMTIVILTLHHRGL
ncbi:hypothetical protein CTAYLR_003430 [Chrysophaeum taylorii]|uniref:Palmitoyltransferase n=1 Tax=Chrysophaeum taylorii TaxID=2483200 RepID=A0AAD7U7W4_9STRA|nr:hypothetical protein CTAYLR_003430 [Chrysophaeum taylorii]